MRDGYGSMSEYEIRIRGRVTPALLARFERHGVLVDAALLGRQSRELAERMVALEREAHELAGQPFNLGSP